MANTIFSQNLRKLRESKKISQKAAAASLGISQALLSHYEKGIRECKLEFLGRAAKFYSVTTDFLLGVSNINNFNISGFIDDNINADGGINPEALMSDSLMLSCINKIKDGELKKDGVEINTYSILYKNLLINAVSYIFDEMKDVKYKDISVLSGKYISVIIYHLYNLLYNSVSPDISEKVLISELKYIIAMKNYRTDENNSNNIFSKYNFENPYLNNIINSNL